jgi:hypothetical protein
MGQGSSRRPLRVPQAGAGEVVMVSPDWIWKDKICWAHYQVSESSDGSDPLVGDYHEPGRWGPRGTHVSQFAGLKDHEYPPSSLVWSLEPGVLAGHDGAHSRSSTTRSRADPVTMRVGPAAPFYDHFVGCLFTRPSSLYSKNWQAWCRICI